jgi:hypothetical protein
MKLKGTAVLLQVNTNNTGIGAAVWKDVACITTNGLDGASDDLDGGSKCGPETVPGDLSWTASLEGFYDLTPSTTQVSGQWMIDAVQAGDEYQWRMRNADDTYYRGFYGTLANPSEQMDYNTLGTFSYDINIRGLIATLPPVT